AHANRPQPALDVDRGRGMTVSVGRLRPCPVLDFKFIALGHNTIRGAAGGAVLNAELMHREGLLLATRFVLFGVRPRAKLSPALKLRRTAIASAEGGRRAGAALAEAVSRDQGASARAG